MKFVYAFSFWMFLSEIKTDAISIHGYTGQIVTTACSHAFAQNNRKYFCRHPCADRDVLVSSDWSSSAKYRLEDFRTGIFTVTITDLQESDAGIYWCGVDRVGIDTYHKVNLQVSKGETKTHTVSTPDTVSKTTQTVSKPLTSEISAFTPLPTGLIKAFISPDVFTDNNTKTVRSVLYAVGGLVVMVTVFAVGLVCVCRYNKRKVQTSARCVSTPPTNLHEYNIEETYSVYENDPDERSNTITKRSKSIQDFHIDQVYQNLHVSTSPADAIYCNL